MARTHADFMGSLETRGKAGIGTLETLDLYPA